MTLNGLGYELKDLVIWLIHQLPVDIRNDGVILVITWRLLKSRIQIQSLNGSGYKLKEIEALINISISLSP